MLRHLVTLVLTAALAAPITACDDAPRGAPAVEPGAPAGDVREVTGTVTARRVDGPARELAAGDPVSSDDVIDTGAAGSVVIELRHNGARWSLAAGQSRRVSESAAWQAARRTEAAATSGDRSTAAGRQAEREGAETGAGAVADLARSPDPAQTPPPPAPERSMQPVKKKKSARRSAEKVATGGGGGALADREGPGGGAADQKTGSARPVDARKAATAGAKVGKVSARGGLSDADARAAIAKSLARLGACARHAGADRPDRVTATAELVVAADGTVDAADLELVDALRSVRACATAALRRVVFAQADQPTTITATIVFTFE
jgi:hypothetical protein